eukprot:TRINITY_DN2380_c0_g1_i1.p1 TRINITY_DN2380_c0_g1~~TRINITY_DN2380_c0_g1_i1.p1  ORF type:complete len:592 (+),score=85.53 TRINITY_DN2380_c0_g1_i1:205-1776(+)
MDLIAHDITILEYDSKVAKGYHILVAKRCQIISDMPNEFLLDPNTKPMKFSTSASNQGFNSSDVESKPSSSSSTSRQRSPSGKPVLKISRINAATDGKANAILGRVTNIGRLFDGVSKRDGKPFVVFNFNLTDETQEIRVSCFGETATRFHSEVKEGKSYFFSGFSVRVVDGQTAKYAPGQYMLSALSNCELIECNDNIAQSLPKMKLDVTPINKIPELTNGTGIDVVGVVKSESEPQVITLKKGGETQKKDVQIVDHSKQYISLTVWGDHVETSFKPGTILGVKSCRVGEFGGKKNLSTSFASKIFVNPAIPEVRGLNDIDYSNAVPLEENRSNQPKMRRIRTIESIKNDISLGTKPEKGDFVNVHVTIFNLRALGNSDDFWYPSCPSGSHNKKVTEDNGVYYCSACQTNYTNCNYAYLFQVLLKDETGNLSATALGEDIGAALFGCSAKELCEFKEADPDEYRARIRNAEGAEFEITLVVRTESYQGVNRIRYNVFRCKRIDYAVELKHLIDDLKQLNVVE